MNTRRRLFVWTALALALALSACGGGGGGGGGAVTLSIQSLLVQTQAQGPLSPFGTTQGGDTVLITGTGFVSGLGVRFGGVAAQVQIVGTNQVEVVTPAGQEGFADVTVTNPGGESTTLSNTFRFVAPPVIVQLQATTGPTTGESRAPIAGGETMQITGQNFKAGIAVSVDGANLPNVTLVNATTLTFPVPGVSNEMTVDVVVTNPEGLTSTLTRGLVYTQEFSLEPERRSLTESRARHLYRRAAFGATQRQIDDALADGLAATVDRLVNYTNDSAVEAEAMAAYGANTPPSDAVGFNANKDWWIHLLAKNPNGFQERFAYFLHDHFATSEAGFASTWRWVMHPQINLFRRFTLGRGQTLRDGSPGLGFDWKRILIEISKDRAMLDWLDGRQSRVGNPNENYARELWELFSLGEGRGYTEDDIKEAARAFTGFLWLRAPGENYLTVQYRPGRHDTGEKTILGATGRFGYDDVFPFHQTEPTASTDAADVDGGVVALTLRQRPVEASTFICRKLAEFFLYDDMHDVVVNELAAQLRAPGADQWNLRPIVTTLLRSKAMYSSRAMKGKIKNPIEFVFGFLRTTGLDLHPTSTTNAARIRGELLATGQVPLAPPDVNGWPSGVAWLGSQGMLERTNFIRFAIQQLDRPEQVEPLVPPAGQRGPTQLVDHVAKLLDVTLSGNARTRMIAYVNSSGSFDPTNETELRAKVRGLLWMIAPYHDGHQD